MFQKLSTHLLLFVLCITINSVQAIPKHPLNDTIFNSRTSAQDILEEYDHININKRNYKRKKALSEKNYLNQIAKHQKEQKKLQKKIQEYVAISALITEARKNTGLAITIEKLLNCD